MPESQQAETSPKERFLQLALERFRKCDDEERENREKMLEDLKFSFGMDQWDPIIVRQRENRPLLTINKLKQPIDQVNNEQRMQRTSPQVNPVGNDSDQDTAEILQGMIRHIEVISDGEVAIDHAFDCMVRTGAGYWRYETGYLPGDTMDQEIIVKRIKDSFTVYVDPNAVEPDYSDARYMFVIESFSREEFKALYPDSELCSWTEDSENLDSERGWMSKDSIRIASYWYVEDEAYTLYRLENGDYTEDTEKGKSAVLSRKKTRRKICVAKITARDILKGNDDLTGGEEWPGAYIPIIPVLGTDFTIDGDRHLCGMVREAKDPCRNYNYMSSKATETIALAPIPPYIMAEGQDEGHEDEWATANTTAYSSLKYKPTDVEGKPAPPPERQAVEPAIQATLEMLKVVDMDIQAVTGLFTPSLGQAKTDQSGSAVRALQKQGDTSNFHYSDNLARSQRYGGRVLIDLIPKVYDAARVQRIIKPDGTHANAVIYSREEDKAAAQALADKNKINKIYNIGVGHYDVTVSVGPSYQTRRQEAVAEMMAIIQAYPQIAPLISDLVVSNMDIVNGKEIAKRLYLMLPPQLQQDENDDPEVALGKIKTDNVKMVQQIQALTAELQQAHTIIQTKQVEQGGKVFTEQMKAEVQLAVAMINAKLDKYTTDINALWNKLEMAAGHAHDVAMATQQQGHEQDMAAQAQAAAPAQGQPENQPQEVSA